MKFFKLKKQNIHSIFYASILLFGVYSCTQENESIPFEEVNELNTVELINSEEFDSYALQNSDNLTSKTDHSNEGRRYIEGEGWTKANAIPVFLPNFILYSADIYQTQNYQVNLMNGKLNGNFEAFNYDANEVLFSHVKGEVLTVVFEEDCKTVRYTGIITESEFNPSMVGKYAFWTSVDNGVRKNDDQTTDIRYGMSIFAANYHYAVGFPLWLFGPGVFQTTEGNIKVNSKNCE